MTNTRATALGMMLAVSSFACAPTQPAVRLTEGEIHEFAAAPETLTVDSLELHFGSQLQRHYVYADVARKRSGALLPLKPAWPKRVRPIEGSIGVVRSDGSPFPDRFRADVAVLIWDSRIWPVRIQHQRNTEALLQGFFGPNDAPKWPVGALVDVSLRLRDSTDSLFYLKRRQVRIKGPDEVSWI